MKIMLDRSFVCGVRRALSHLAQIRDCSLLVLFTHFTPVLLFFWFVLELYCNGTLVKLVYVFSHFNLLGVM